MQKVEWGTDKEVHLFASKYKCQNESDKACPLDDYEEYFLQV